jgi:LysR family transcriptional regulator, transcriptional activator of nhaA
LLGEADVSIFGTPALAARYRDGFPRSLHGAPMLLPTRNTAIRGRLDHWFESNDIVPQIQGEFEDSGLLKIFGRYGLGLFPALTIVADDVAEQLGARQVGEIHEVREQLYALSTERRIKHPAVEAIRNSVQAKLFRTSKRLEFDASNVVPA